MGNLGLRGFRQGFGIRVEFGVIGLGRLRLGFCVSGRAKKDSGFRRFRVYGFLGLTLTKSMWAPIT